MEMASLSRKPLGELLIEVGGVDARHVDHALQQQRTQGGLLGEWLVQDGILPRREVIKALARQHDLAFVSLHVTLPQAQALDCLAPHDARRLRMVPVSLKERDGVRHLVMAMSEPQQQAQLPALARALGIHLQAALCDPEELQECLDWYEGLQVRNTTQRTDEDQRGVVEEISADELVELDEPSLEELLEVRVATPKDTPETVLLRRVELLEWELAGARKNAQAERDLLEQRLTALEARVAELMGQATPQDAVPEAVNGTWDDPDGFLEPPTLTSAPAVDTGKSSSPFAELLAEASGLRRAPR